MSSSTNFALTPPSGGTNFALTPPPGGTAETTLPEISVGGDLPGDGSYGDPIQGFHQINQQASASQQAFSAGTGAASNAANASFQSQNTARAGAAQAQFSANQASLSASTAPLFAPPPITGPILPPNFAETARKPGQPAFGLNGPLAPPGVQTPPETTARQAADAIAAPSTAPGLPAFGIDGAAVAEGAASLAGRGARFAGSAAGRTIPILGTLAQLRDMTGPAVGPGLTPEQQALTGRTLLDPTPLAEQAVAAKPPFLSDGFTTPSPPATLAPPAAFTPLPGAAAQPLPGFTPAPVLPGVEGLTPTLPQGFGALPGFAAAPPQGLAIPGFTPAAQTPALPGFGAVDSTFAEPQITNAVPSTLAQELAKINKTADNLLASGSRADPADASGEYTVAGRAAQKHGSRPGSAFPQVKGPPRAMNEQGAAQLQDIIANVKDVFASNVRGGFDVIAQDGRGARFNAIGEFIGFLQP